MLNLTAKQRTNWLYALGLLFALANGVFIALEFYYFALLPLVMLVLWAAFMRLDLLLLFVVFSTPLSLNLEELDLGHLDIGFYLPTEPLLFGILILFIFKLLYGKSIDPKIFKHPVSLAIYGYLTWMFLTCITSTMPLVSFKFLLSKMWFIAAFYFLAVHIFKNPIHIRRYFVLYLIPLTGVIIYTIIHHSQYGFDMDAGHWVMSPFFKDHTSYGAVLAMFLPPAIGLSFMNKFSPLLRFFLLSAVAILVVGIILSYTRAAWVSLAAVAALYVLMVLRVRLNLILVVTFVSGFLIWNYQEQLLIELKRNSSESSDELAEHVESISNVTSDNSNLERLNRWDAAISMFKEKPVFGFGPGTYQFQYAPYQKSENLTWISTNNADGGNAHSEYLGPLAETGFMGTITVLILCYVVLHLGFRLFFTVKNPKWRIVVVSTFLGWVTYIIHGTLNNYLDTDKASIPFWGFIAILVAIDLYHKEEEKDGPALENPAA
ncbi:O-antigen ligase family protein [Halocola ammonii]